MQTLMAQIATAKPNTVITGSLSTAAEAVTFEAEMARRASAKTAPPAAR